MLRLCRVSRPADSSWFCLKVKASSRLSGLELLGLRGATSVRASGTVDSVQNLANVRLSNHPVTTCHN